MKDVAKRTIILGIIFILMMMNIISIQASENKKDVFPQKTQVINENILGTVIVKWNSFFARLALRDLPPIIIFNQSATRDFYFPEINGTIQLNFTLICRHRYDNYTLFPRFTRFELLIKYNNEHVFDNRSIFYLCKSLKWEYYNITVDENDLITAVQTNGQNVTLQVTPGMRGFPFKVLGNYSDDWEPITVHPIPTPP